MQKHASNKENNSQSSLDRFSNKPKRDAASSFEDNRSITVNQRKLQEAANNSEEVRQMARFQEMANESSAKYTPIQRNVISSVLQRQIDDSEKNNIQVLTKEEVIARMNNPPGKEEAGEIATLWLEHNKSEELSELEQWTALIRAHDPGDDEVVPNEQAMDMSDDSDEVVPNEQAMDMSDDSDEVVPNEQAMYMSDDSDDEMEEKSELVLTPIELWLGEAAKIKALNITLQKIEDNKIARILMIYSQGIFNPIGQGGNPRYIRSDKNAVVKLTVGGLSKDKNKAGEIPDVFQRITPSEWILVIDVLGKSKEANLLEFKGNISEYILAQRKVSVEIMEKTKLQDSQEGKLPLIILIFDGNYTGLNIHFPALMNYIKNNQEIESKVNKVGAGQGKGITKFLMGRLMFLCNSKISDKNYSLVEQSSFGFQRPTVGDLGDNMTIRLSPGVNTEIVPHVVGGILQLYDELKMLMEDNSDPKMEQMKNGSDIYEYWNSATRGPKGEILLKSYNLFKTKLNHLLFTQIENGALGKTIIGRTFDRNHNNILKLTMEDHSLLDWAAIILNMHQPDKLIGSLNGNTLSSPEMLTKSQLTKMAMHTGKDFMANQRLALFQNIAEKLKADSKPEVWDEEGSDSEFEDDDVFGGKAVVPSGMASLSQMLGNVVKTKDNQIESKMKPGLYYEDFDHAKRNFNVAGYTTADVVVVDLNPNLANTQERDKLGNGAISTMMKVLEGSGRAVWMVDMTSSIANEQRELYKAWKEKANAKLLILLVSGLKHQEKGLNTNPHGLIHWAYKGHDKLEALRTYFDGIRKEEVNNRSKISNHMRRYHKDDGSHSWTRIDMTKKEDNRDQAEFLGETE